MQGGLEPTLGTMGTGSNQHTPRANLELPTNLPCKLLDCGRKLEPPANPRKHRQSMQTSHRKVLHQTQGSSPSPSYSSANHCTTVPPWANSSHVKSRRVSSDMHSLDKPWSRNYVIYSETLLVTSPGSFPFREGICSFFPGDGQLHAIDRGACGGRQTTDRRLSADQDGHSADWFLLSWNVNGQGNAKNPHPSLIVTAHAD